ncbi:MAG: glycosyl transferase [Clostridiales bacterium]|nr:glycosyl transferase [Clostridiales bacterium]
MIPKTIHYCWFGRGTKPKLAEKCIESWHKYCPDYEITEWNEDNFDVSQNSYMRYCLAHRQYAFLSDLVRLHVVHEYGGIYFDTDVELLRNPEELLSYEAFYGFENNSYINTGLGFGAEKKHRSVRAMIERYNTDSPNLGVGGTSDTDADDLNYQPVGCPRLNTEALLPFGLSLDGKRQSVADAEIFPPSWFNPFDSVTGKLECTGETISIHWYSKSWMSGGERLRSNLLRPIHRVFGK